MHLSLFFLIFYFFHPGNGAYVSELIQIGRVMDKPMYLQQREGLSEIKKLSISKQLIFENMAPFLSRNMLSNARRLKTYLKARDIFPW
jgi:hypothetical protein